MMTMADVYDCGILDVEPPPGFKLTISFRPPLAGEYYLHPSGIEASAAAANYPEAMPRLILERA